MAKRISIINFKGGVGKTTFAFNFACGLVRYFDGVKVLLVDVDHQSSLSIVTMGSEIWEDSVSSERTITSMFKNFTNEGASFDRSDIVFNHPLGEYHYGGLDIVPASLELDDVEIELTASHQGNAIKSEWNKRTLLCRWLEESKLDRKYDYIIFDCPPATKIVSQNAIAASHGYIIPVVPEAVMERGAPHLHNMIRDGIDRKLKALSTLGDKRKLFIQKTKLFGLVVTRATVSGPAYSGYINEHTFHLNSMKRAWKNDLLKPYVPTGAGVTESLSSGWPVYDYPNNQNIGRRNIHGIYRQLTENVKTRIDES